MTKELKELPKKDSIKIKCPLCRKKIPSTVTRCSKCTGDLDNELSKKDIQLQLQSRRKKRITTGVLFVIIIIFIVISVGDDSTSQPKTQKQSIEQAKVINEGSAFKLASLEIGNGNPPKELIGNFQTLLNKLGSKCPNENEKQIAGYIFVGQQKIKEGLGPITLLEVGKGIDRSIPKEMAGVVTCAEIAAAFVTLTVNK